ncbi:EamA family transporter RarD [Brevibacillus sp. SYP-B805]|uniref:EamA family transporter RarD n=1 Tax=Brevibacillus sp. SYP-B805 TaxID=1578199 RepID=UPI0013EAAA61|nr:EamA family transporter RarD [Brevibacillus sp. SYP-B805]NGQ95866.1 EamA family transporter RarD [Brevibacillus sp. SYP-B805]
MNKGIMYGVLAYLLWGLLPLYWKLFLDVPADELLGHRIVWSFFFVGLILLLTRSWKRMGASLGDRRKRFAVIFCSLVISVNWLLFIWAVNAGHVLETSLGYYINPLINVVFGVLFLKEKMKGGQWVAIGLATVGVAIMTLKYGQVPWVAIALALTFALYGLGKKVAGLESMVSLAWETMLVLPIALAYLLWIHAAGTDVAVSLSAGKWMLLMLSGVATALPLYWFAQAARTLPLSMIGFLQYLAPSTSLLLAVFLFKEPFTVAHLVSFGLIWSGLAVFTFTTVRKKPAEPQVLADSQG